MTPYSLFITVFEVGNGEIGIWERDYSTAIVVETGYALLTQTFGIGL